MRTVIVMLKEPRPGRVKTRLGRDIGMTAAAWWFRHQVTGLLRRIDDPRWRAVLAVAPDHAGLRSRVWPATFARMPQGAGHLGDRMARMLRAVRALRAAADSVHTSVRAAVARRSSRAAASVAPGDTAATTEVAAQVPVAEVLTCDDRA